MDSNGPSSPGRAATTVALLGGSFDPPHVCHVLVSLYVMQAGGVDEVWWLPCAEHAFGKRSAPFPERVAMCEIATRRVRGIRVDCIEAELPTPSYTLDTIHALRARHPDVRFCWIAGTDLLPELVRWHRWSTLARELSFVVVRRGDEPPDLPADGSFRCLPVVFPDVSSTAVRAALEAGEDVSGLVDDEVREHLRRRGSYS